MTTDDNSIQRAIELHTSGRWSEAERIYRQSLQTDPNNAAVLNLLGVVCGQQGQLAEAVQLMERAVALRPDTAEFHSNLARVYAVKGEAEKAFVSARNALSLQPNDIIALTVGGNVLRHLGRLPEALEWLQRSLSIQANQPEALEGLIDLYRRAGKLPEADACGHRLLALQPTNIQGLTVRGEALLTQRRFAEAAPMFESLTQADPQSWVGYNGLAVALFRLGRIAEAIPLFEKSIQLAKDDPCPLQNAGHACMSEGLLEQAIDFFHRALALRPDVAEIHNNLGVAYAAQLDLKRAMDAFNRALFFQPENQNAHWSRSLLLLLQGNFAEGFHEYEWRWLKYPHQRRDFRQPAWDGYDIAGKTILLHGEQGFGDEIQFVRFAPMVADRGARVIVECAPELASLFSRTPGVSQVVARGSSIPGFDYQCPLMSTAYALGVTFETIPHQVPYVHFDPALQQQWARAVAPYERDLNVGIVWSGSPTQARNRERSTTLEALAPLGSLKGVRFFSLQFGDAAKMPVPPGLDLVDLTRDVRNFDDTAALMANLDLVVSVDTSVCHLAGALGKPTFAMLAYSADWRWHLDREDSPWYPTMRLFRQRTRRDWAEVIARVRTAIEATLSR